MCGIYGYIGIKNAIRTVLEGLKKLEYRGYDSAGIATIEHHQLKIWKEAGKIQTLEQQIESTSDLHIAIGHTRWATHGQPSKLNAHPHTDWKNSLAIVHNGIIENHAALKKILIADGIPIVSDTDTEIVAHLISKFYDGDLLHAVKNVLPLLTGSFAIALIHKDHPDEIIAFAHDAPLTVGFSGTDIYVSSDSNALRIFTKDVIFLTSGEIARLKSDKLEIYSNSLELIDKEYQQLSHDAIDISKGSWEHYTLKEINEQPQTLKNAMHTRYIEEEGNAFFEEIDVDLLDLHSVNHILIVACGTSLHAGYAAAYMLEEKARIPVEVEISSEFRYKNPIVQDGTLAIAISQSGETADTLAAVKEIKAKGAKVLAICNIPNSALARMADNVILLHAGPEIGVCSTKAFTSQVMVLTLITLLLSRMRNLGKADGQQFIKELKKIPEQIEHVLANSKNIEEIAKRYADYENFFFIGRHYMYPTSLEGALKLKEISYINANAYPAGEMKHGPIALISPQCPTVALCANKQTLDKMLSNIEEVKARKGPILAIVPSQGKSIVTMANDIIEIPDTIDELAILPTTVALQLLAYYIAKIRGTDIDQPRNLAKSVTVE